MSDFHLVSDLIPPFKERLRRRAKLIERKERERDVRIAINAGSNTPPGFGEAPPCKICQQVSAAHWKGVKDWDGHKFVSS